MQDEKETCITFLAVPSCFDSVSDLPFPFHGVTILRTLSRFWHYAFTTHRCWLWSRWSLPLQNHRTDDFVSFMQIFPRTRSETLTVMFHPYFLDHFCRSPIFVLRFEYSTFCFDRAGFSPLDSFSISLWPYRRLACTVDKNGADIQGQYARTFVVDKAYTPQYIRLRTVFPSLTATVTCALIGVTLESSAASFRTGKCLISYLFA